MTLYFLPLQPSSIIILIDAIFSDYMDVTHVIIQSCNFAKLIQNILL